VGTSKCSPIEKLRVPACKGFSFEDDKGSYPGSKTQREVPKRRWTDKAIAPNTDPVSHRAQNLPTPHVTPFRRLPSTVSASMALLRMAPSDVLAPRKSQRPFFAPRKWTAQCLARPTAADYVGSRVPRCRVYSPCSRID
jgi:hypothetical protein